MIDPALWFCGKRQHMEELKRRGVALLPEAFGVDRSKTNGQQSWCRQCKSEWERTPEHRYGRLSSTDDKTSLMSKEPHVFRAPDGWSKDKYLAQWLAQGGLCHFCGVSLTFWTVGGHCLDRRDNSIDHWPQNCLLTCWPCNAVKGNKPYRTFAAYVQALRAQFPGGPILWNEACPEGALGRKFQPHLPVDVSMYEVPVQQVLSFEAGR